MTSLPRATSALDPLSLPGDPSRPGQGQQHPAVAPVATADQSNTELTNSHMSTTTTEAPPAPAATEPGTRQKGARRMKPGDVFERWTVVSDAGGTHAMAYRWNCRCSCGTERSVLEYSLLYGASQSCGCLNTERNFEGRMATARERFVGKTFGWLTVTDVLPAAGHRRNFVFKATCSCGAGLAKEGRVADLAAGKVSSCCGPAPYTEASQRLLLDVLAQLRDGAQHYAADHRILKVLGERGAYDPVTRTVTPAGLESLAAGALHGYMADLHVRRERRSEVEKRALVQRTFESGLTVVQVAREAKVAESLLSRWRKQLRDTLIPADSAATNEPQGAAA